MTHEAVVSRVESLLSGLAPIPFGPGETVVLPTPENDRGAVYSSWTTEEPEAEPLSFHGGEDAIGEVVVGVWAEANGRRGPLLDHASAIRSVFAADRSLTDLFWFPPTVTDPNEDTPGFVETGWWGREYRFRYRRVEG